MTQVRSYVVEPTFVTTGCVGDLLRTMENTLAGEGKLCLTQYLFIERRKPIQDLQILNLLFAQLRRDILRGYLPCTESEALKLAYARIQYDLGDHNEQNRNFQLAEYLPSALIALHSAEEWNQKLNQGHFGMLGTLKEQCQRQFVHCCQSLKHFGCLMVDAEMLELGDWKQVSQSAVKIALHEGGLEIYSQDLNQLYLQFSMTELTRWRRLEPPANAVELTIAGHTSLLSFKASPADCTFLLGHLQGYVSAFIRRSDYATALRAHVPEKEAQNWDLLSFQEGDVIRVISHNPGNGWEFGMVNDQYGNFPVSFVKHTTHTAATSPSGHSAGAITRVVTE